MAVESTAPLNLDAPTLPVMPLPPAGLSTGAATAPTSPQTDLQLRERLFETVQQLLVGVTPGGAVEVRMVLRDNVLPGVTLIVQQAAGQLQVSFECTAQASQLRLERAGPAFAQTLARRLGRDVAMQVQGAQGGALRFDARPDAEEVTP